MEDETEQQSRDEAERLVLVDRETQELHIAMLREVAANPKVPKTDRDLANERANSLEKHLKRLRKRKNNKT
jgi:hypothetical protein